MGLLPYVWANCDYYYFPNVEHMKKFALKLGQDSACYNHVIDLPVYSQRTVLRKSLIDVFPPNRPRMLFSPGDNQ